MGELAAPTPELPEFDAEPTLAEVLLYAQKVEAYINNHQLSDDQIGQVNEELNNVASGILVSQEVTVSGCYRIVRPDGAGIEQYYLEEGLLSGISQGFVIEPYSYFRDELGDLSDSEEDVSIKILESAKGTLMVSHVLMCNEEVSYTIPIGSFVQTRSLAVVPIGTATIHVPEVRDQGVDYYSLSEDERLVQLLPEEQRDAVIGLGYELLYSSDPLKHLGSVSPQIEAILGSISHNDQISVAKFLHSCCQEAQPGPIYIPPEQNFVFEKGEANDNDDENEELTIGSFDLPMEAAVLALIPYNAYEQYADGNGDLVEGRMTLYAHAIVAKNPLGGTMQISIPLSHYAGRPARQEQAA